MSRAIIEQLPASDGRPDTTYRYVGDRYLLVEYGGMEVNLFYNLRAIGLSQQLVGQKGIIESVPAFRSLLVHFEPSIISLKDVLLELKSLEQNLTNIEELNIPSRSVELPISFKDQWTSEFIGRYNKNIRSDAPNIINGNNIEYVAKYNGLESVDDLIEAVTSTEWWATGIGFWPGLPFLMPLDPRAMMTAPKYNPTRPWTPEGAVGIGGPCIAIYSISSPGGYQLLGRTILIYDQQQRNRVFRENPVLLRLADRITFSPVTDEQLEEIRRKIVEDTYRYRITNYELFSVRKYVEFLNNVATEAKEFLEKQEQARKSVSAP